MRPRLGALALAPALALALAAPVAATTAPAAQARVDDTRVATTPAASASAARGRARPVPRLAVSTRVRGLSHPWDVKSLGSGRLLVTEREPASLTLVTGGRKQRVAFPYGKLYVNGETGLMGLEVDPGFERNHRIYTCSGWKTGRGHEVRVNAFRLNADATRAHLVKALVTGLPSTSGRHGGCRLLIADNGPLVVGTGDAATGRNPRNLHSLGGKTLRLNRFTGKPWPRNPFIRSRNQHQRYVLTYGHRNVQGLAQRRDGSLWSVEHGTYRDDEVNKLVSGGDYGYNPVPGYNESVPMTDQSLPGRQIGARWRSGEPTRATSGATWVYGRKWQRFNGSLAVAALKAERLMFMKFDERGRHPHVYTPRALRRYGRLRTVTQLGNGNLLVCTDGENGAGRVLLVRPR